MISESLKLIWRTQVVAIGLSFLAMTAGAADYSGGSGTPGDPYQIETVTDWITFAVYPEISTTGLSGICILTMVKKKGCRWARNADNSRIISRPR